MSADEPAMLWEEDDAVSRRAAAYFSKRRFGDWSAEDQTELDAWLQENALHEVAFLRLEGIAAGAVEMLALRSSRPALNILGGVPGNENNLRRFVFPFLAAASVALAATFGGRLVAYLMQPPDSIDSTTVGGRTLLSYADRTQIELNTNTSVRVRMTTAERTVWLEKGEAWFHVAHDAAHPFTVIVGNHRVTDLGTEFLVRRDADGVDVTLLNGRATLGREGAQTATLRPGDEATATSASLSVTRRTPQELEDELAWRRGMLVFRNAPLSEVVREFNRYSTVKLVIADPSIADLKFSGEMATDRYGDFLQLAQTVLKLRVDRKGNEILISRSVRERTKRAERAKHGL